MRPRVCSTARLSIRVALASVACSAACARAPRPAGPTARAAQGRTQTDTVAANSSATPVWLSVENHNRANVVLYVVRGYQRQRLGQVTAGATQRLRIAPDVVRDAAGFSLTADPIGGDPPGRTEVLHVFPGQRIVWTLEASLARSSLAIYQ